MDRNKFYAEEQLDYQDVLIAQRRSDVLSRKDVELKRVYTFKWCPRKISGVGIIAANMDTTGTFEMARTLQNHSMFTALNKHYSLDQLRTFLTMNPDADHVFISTGIKDGDYYKVRKIMDEGLCNNICIDIAHGGLTSLPAFVNKVRTDYPDALIMAGNVSESELAIDLIHAGTDLVKAGIGPGSVCRTRAVAGVGRPQLSTVLDLSKTCHNNGAMLVADGGIVEIGDVAKAIGAGADFVMIGGMFAGTDEAAGDLVESSDGVIRGTDRGELYMEISKYKVFYGMASEHAQDKHNGGMNKYRASEGKVVKIPYKGSADRVAQDIEGGLRSACTYTGTQNIQDLEKNTKFYLVRRTLNNVFGK